MSTTRKNPSRKPTSPKTPQTASPAVINVEGKVDERRASIVAELTAVIKSSEERVMQKIGELAGDIANLRQSLTAMEKRVTAVENSCVVAQTLRGELDAVRAQLAEIQSSAVATDVIINGIPHATDESLPEIFDKVCGAAQHKTPPLRDAFRIQSKGKMNNSNAPIVIKLFSANDRTQLFRSLAAFCKSRKRSLSLSDINFPGYGNIYLHESLPKVLREVMAYASELRRKKLLTSAFSIRGKVYVRRKANEKPQLVCTREDVNALTSTTN